MKKKPQNKGIHYDLGCGSNLQLNHIGIDVTKKGTQADIEHDLVSFPWPIKSNSADSVFASHFLEHIPHGNGSADPFFRFFDEVYRILKKNGTGTFIVPYYTSIRSIQDPTHLRFIGEATFLYLNRKWREVNKLQHYPVSCNFEVVNLNHSVNQEFQGRAQEAVQYAAAHYWNVVDDLVVTIRKV